MKNKNNSSSDAWRMKLILHSAFKRWQGKFLSYVLTYAVFAGIWILCSGAIALTGGIITLIFFLFFKNFSFFPVIFLLWIIAFFVTSLYLFSFLLLTSVNLLIKEKTTVFASMRSVKPFVWGYVWVGIISALFLSGLLPFGIMTFFSITVLWSFWSSFTTFVYLEKKEKGLQNLWVSRSIYNLKFKNIFFKSLLMLGLGLLISASHTIAVWTIGRQSFAYHLILILSYVLNFIYTSYLICFNYELYKRLEKPSSVKPPKVWIGLSIFGWIINIFLIISLTGALSGIIANLKNNSLFFPSVSRTKTLQTSDIGTLIYTGYINQPVQAPDRIFTLISAQTVNSKQTFILTNVLIKNTGQNTFSYSPYDFFLQDRNNILDGPAFSFLVKDEDMLGSGKLYPGAVKTGIVSFEANKASAPFTLLYKPYSSAQKFVVKIKL